MRVFFVVLARGSEGVEKKTVELGKLGFPFVIVCGERMEFPNVVYREPRGKYDAVNFGMGFVPPDTDIVAFNDVDAVVHDFEAGLAFFKDPAVSLVLAKVDVERGPQLSFYSLLDSLRDRFPIAASGELMLIRRSVLNRILPLRACKAEDSYVLFRVLEEGGRVVFSQDCYVTTKRTSVAEEEQGYKRRTVGGIYQALSMSRPPMLVRLFYVLLPFVSPLLLLSGKKGYHWAKGILLGYVDCLRGDKTASWKPTYGQNS